MIEVNYNEYKETIAENIKLIQTNHKLKEKYYLMRTNANQLAKRIDKAIEHLEESINFYLKSDEVKVISIDSVKERYLQPVLDILKGSEK